MNVAENGAWAIRPYEQADVRRVAELANNIKVARNLADVFPHPYTDADAEAWWTMVRDRLSTEAFAIAVDGIFAGGISWHPQGDVKRHTVLIGYWLGEPYWGRGIATWAVGAIVAHAFGARPEMVRVCADVFGWNPASARVLEKNGFQLEGVLRRGVCKFGEYTDLLCYGLVRDEWEAVPRAV